jgi:hypothetical protein
MVLATAGGVAVFMQPPLVNGKLTAAAREVFAAVGQAVLDGSLPRGPAREPAVVALVQHVEGLVGTLPPHAQSELSQLLAILASAPGRYALAGLQADWREALLPHVQSALQGMRTSGSTIKRQAYQALHDIVGAAYVSDPSVWKVLGYPGPREIG